MEISKTFKDEIWDYCRANNITNIDDFTLKCLKQGFTALKFGSTPAPVKEVIVEKIVEVEKVIEKEVFVTDKKSDKKLTDKIEQLQSESLELNQKVKDLENQLQEEKNKKKRDIYGE
jgi:uncharacterized protein YlxW (UPF0749 family)